MFQIPYLFGSPDYYSFQWRFRDSAAKESFKVIPANRTYTTKELEDNFLTYIAGGEL